MSAYSVRTQPRSCLCVVATDSQKLATSFPCVGSVWYWLSTTTRPSSRVCCAIREYVRSAVVSGVTPSAMRRAASSGVASPFDGRVGRLQAASINEAMTISSGRRLLETCLPITPSLCCVTITSYDRASVQLVPKLRASSATQIRGSSMMETDRPAPRSDLSNVPHRRCWGRARPNGAVDQVDPHARARGVRRSRVPYP